MGNWTERRACNSGSDPSVFFPDRAGDNGFTAKRTCAGCPVRGDCLAYALETSLEHGIFGGAGDAVRRWLRRLWRTSGHERAATDVCGDPGCDYHAAVVDHFDRLDHFARTGRQAPGARALFGPGARHGTAATAKKGCGCPRCRLALAVSAREPRGAAKIGA